MLQEGSIFLTDELKEWARTQEVIFRMQPKRSPERPHNPALMVVYDLGTHRYLEMFFAGVTLVNIVVFSMEYFGMGDAYAFALNVVNMICSCLFTLEICIKLAGLRLAFFNDSINLFDFACVVLADFSCFYGLVTRKNGFIDVSKVARFLRLQRVFLFSLEIIPCFSQSSIS